MASPSTMDSGWLLLSQVLVLLVVFAGFSRMFGFRKAAGKILVAALALGLLVPLGRAFASRSPAWFSLILLAAIALLVLRGLLAVAIGREASQLLVGAAVAKAF